MSIADFGRADDEDDVEERRVPVEPLEDVPPLPGIISNCQLLVLLLFLDDKT